MPTVYKMSLSGLKKLIAEEKAALVKEGDFGPIRDVTKEPKKTKEVEACELADTLEKEIDYLKVQKVHEAKLLSQLKRLREEMKLRFARINEAKKAKPSTVKATSTKKAK